MVPAVLAVASALLPLPTSSYVLVACAVLLKERDVIFAWAVILGGREDGKGLETAQCIKSLPDERRNASW